MSDHFLLLVKHQKATFYKSLSLCVIVCKISKAIGKNACLDDAPLFRTFSAPRKPCCLSNAVLFLFHYFKHSETFQAQNELQGRLLKAEGETHSWAACDLVTPQPESSALTEAPC